MVTLAIVQHLMGGLLLQLIHILLCEGKDLGENRRFDVSHLRSTVLGAEKFVDATETPAECAIEVVLDSVVSAALAMGYRPSRHLAISVHLLPYFLCASNIMRSSRSLHGSLLMVESR